MDFCFTTPIQSMICQFPHYPCLPARNLGSHVSGLIYYQYQALVHFQFVAFHIYKTATAKAAATATSTATAVSATTAAAFLDFQGNSAIYVHASNKPINTSAAFSSPTSAATKCSQPILYIIVPNTTATSAFLQRRSSRIYSEPRKSCSARSSCTHHSSLR